MQMLLSFKSLLIRSSSLHPPKSRSEQTGSKLTETNESREGVKCLALRGRGVPPPAHSGVFLNMQLMLGLFSALSLSGIRSSWASLALCCWIQPFLQPSPYHSVLTTGFSINYSPHCNMSSLGQTTLSLACDTLASLTKLMMCIF